ncbi:hypothetical protein HME9304_01198 [Flagellimonas maritima]|uniref:N-acetyltransferase domain-containing protein n=1 Tax=Flagellimonas maritima TaxID=1383885 RepID=A0A2Z4LS82_9FLAO|nr:GNAT family N-acetyltransferase [Allomuricauda aurantiaca]AWX44198.1 hypothetical protein HME9304_01198 [Allomuricauda aurantiaca]
MVTYKQASSKKELEQILLLQKQNLAKNLTEKEKSYQGFLTVEHSFVVLKAMNDACGHILAIENDLIIGYALCMHPRFADSVEILKPMFREISKVVNMNTNYMVMGQICIAKHYRGKGVFRNLYKEMKKVCQRVLISLLRKWIPAINVLCMQTRQLDLRN